MAFGRCCRVAVFAVAGALLAGCQNPKVATQGASGIEATYSMGVLKAVLPHEARVPAVIAAADEAARARGYTVVSNATTDEHGSVVCRPPRSDSYPRVVIDARRIGAGTRTTVEMQPWGDQELCRSMLDAILQKLGL